MRNQNIWQRSDADDQDEWSHHHEPFDESLYTDDVEYDPEVQEAIIRNKPPGQV